MVVANVPESDFKAGPHCVQCGNRTDLALHFTASRNFRKILREGRVEPPTFSPEVRERLESVYCEACDCLWRLVPDTDFETQRALVAARQKLAQQDQFMECPPVLTTVIQ
jgi:hypothetical protein